jgi:HK97 family phage major capsid protein
MLARLTGELEEKRVLQEQLIDSAQRDQRDLKPEESELYQRASERMGVIEGMLVPIRESLRISNESRLRSQELTDAFDVHRNGAKAQSAVEYRSAGEYIVDHWRAAIGDGEARERMALYTRAAAHQTTADNLGVIPQPVVGPVIAWIDAARPIVDSLGPRPVPGGRFVRPRVTQHVDSGPQSAEKAELVSRKMLIDSIPVSMSTYGGYVNVSRQNIDFSAPQIMDLVVTDLAAAYAIDTEGVAAESLVTGAIAQTPALSAASTAAEVTAAVWKAAGTIFAATKGVGRVVIAAAPDMIGVIGPLFPAINPTNAQSAGFSAGDLATGVVGSVSGISVLMSAGLAPGTIIAYSTAAAEVYEQRLGALQVTEPSVLGVQVAYAGYFAIVEVLPAAILKLTA